MHAPAYRIFPKVMIYEITYGLELILDICTNMILVSTFAITAKKITVRRVNRRPYSTADAPDLHKKTNDLQQYHA